MFLYFCVCFLSLLVSFRQKSDVLSKGDVEDIDEEFKKLDLLYVSMTANFLWYVFPLLLCLCTMKLISAVNFEDKQELPYTNVCCRFNSHQTIIICIFIFIMLSVYHVFIYVYFIIYNIIYVYIHVRRRRTVP